MIEGRPRATPRTARPKGHAARWRIALALVVLVAGLIGRSPAASAHTPHDNIDDVAISPSYARDRTVFVISGGRLLKSTDAGDHWASVVLGLPRPAEQGKDLDSVAIAPSDGKVMYLSSRLSGMFRSTDGGYSWEKANSGLVNLDMHEIAVSPTSARTVLASGTTGGLYRTTDGGRSWLEVKAPGPKGFRLVKFGRVPAVTFLADPSGRAVAGDGAGQVWVSDDGGESWQRSTAATKAAVSAVGSVPGAAGTVVVGTSNGTLFRSTDGGETFAPIGTGLPAQAIQSIVASPKFATDRTLWAATYHDGTYRSTDRGATWTRQSAGLTTDRQADDIKVTQFQEVRAATDGAGKVVLFEAGYDGLFRKVGDARWQPVETLTEMVVGLGISPTFDKDHTVAVTTYVKGAYITVDGGATWSRIDDGLRHPISDGNKFAPVRRLHNVVFSPQFATDHTIFSASWVGFLKSTDRGRSWKEVTVSAAPSDTNLRQFVIALSPDYAKDRTILLGTRQGDFYRSTKAGDKGSWSHIGKVDSRIRTIAFSPTYRTDHVVFASTTGGVVESRDQGATWRRTGPAGLGMLAISPEFASDGTLFAGTLEGLFVTHDKAKTWTEVTKAPLTTLSRVEAVAISPDFAHDRTVMVSIGGVGLFRSTDGGASFAAVGKDLAQANHVIADFTNPTSQPLQFSSSFATDHTIYAYAGSDVLRSTDGGDTWSVLMLPSAEAFLKAIDAGQSGVQGEVASRSGVHQIHRRRIAAIVGGVVVVLGLIAGGVWLVRRRRRVDPPEAPA